MNKLQAEAKANELMELHGITEKGWIFVFDNAKLRYGCCKHRYKQITLSQYMLPHMADSDIIDTILHEIAHALVGRGNGHNWIWRRKAREIGCKAQRCGSKIKDRSKLTYKWTGTCPNGHVSNRHKLTKRSRNCSCGRCSDKYNPEFKFDWVENH
jgi:predicted SprT family Zn-dependent metalloprotease